MRPRRRKPYMWLPTPAALRLMEGLRRHGIRSMASLDKVFVWVRRHRQRSAPDWGQTEFDARHSTVEQVIDTIQGYDAG